MTLEEKLTEIDERCDREDWPHVSDLVGSDWQYLGRSRGFDNTPEGYRTAAKAVATEFYGR